jgi:iron complex transport system substrate-binding protein
VPRTPRRSRAVRAVLAVFGGLILAACSSTSPGVTTTTPTPAPASGPASTTPSATSVPATATSAPVAAATFPVTIPHKLGSTTIPAAPKRVVTVSWQNQDVVVALGVQPVAVPKVTYGNDDKGLAPWTTEALGSNPVPILMDETNGLAFEAISNAKPDLILAVYSGISQQDYDTLAKIAPTVAYPNAPYAGDWRDTTTTIGKALGKPAEAAKLIADTDKYLKGLAAKYPALTGKSFAYILPEAAQLDVYVPSDSRVSLLTALGMTVPPSVTALGATATSFYVGVPFENLDTVTSDMLIFLVADDAAEKTLLDNPFVQAMPQVKKGAYALIKGTQLAFAASAPSVLSIKWGFERIVPLLGAAAGKV